MSDLSLYRGDDATFTVTANDSSGNAVDLSGTTLIWTAKRSKFDADADAVLQKKSSDGGVTILTQSGATLGQATITVDAVDTDSLTRQTFCFWDLEVVDGSGKVRTLATGTLMIQLDYSRAVS
jgi:hypothetical protein